MMMKRVLFKINDLISKFGNFRRMEEQSDYLRKQLLDYSKFDPNKTIIVDVDGTILQAKNRDYENAEEKSEIIQKLNSLHENGWTVIYFTARGQLSKNGNMKRIEKENRPILEKWLSDHSVKYDYLLFCKPYGAWYLDDKALNPQDFLSKNFS